MRLSDLIGKEVVDESGESLRHVHDVAAVRQGPEAGSFGPALQVDCLLVGARGIWSRLGVSASHFTEHPILRRLSRLGKEADEIDWDDVVRIEDERIVVRT